MLMATSFPHGEIPRGVTRGPGSEAAGFLPSARMASGDRSEASALRRLARSLLAGLFGVALCWLALLVLTALAADLAELYRHLLPPRDERIALPNYPDKGRARQIFWGGKLTTEEYAPFVGWTRLPQQGPGVNIGADGFRVHKQGRDSGADAPSVGIFGGSAVWGTGVDDDSTIPAFFDQQSQGYRVFSYAQGGHNARQNLALLVNLIAEQRMPELVLFYNGHNHIIHCYGDSLNSHGAYERMRTTLAERPRFGSLYHDLIAPPVRRIQELLRKRKKGGVGGRCDDDPELADRVAQTLVRIWEMANLLVTANGGRFYAFVQPTAFTGSPRLDHLTLRRGDRREQNAAVYARLRAHSRGMHFVSDLSHAFDGDEYIYIDSAHVSGNGNEIIARHMIERLRADGIRLSVGR